MMFGWYTLIRDWLSLFPFFSPIPEWWKHLVAESDRFDKQKVQVMLGTALSILFKEMLAQGLCAIHLRQKHEEHAR